MLRELKNQSTAVADSSKSSRHLGFNINSAIVFCEQLYCDVVRVEVCLQESIGFLLFM